MKVTVDNTEFKLDNVKQGSSVAIDVAGEPAAAAPAAAASAPTATVTSSSPGLSPGHMRNRVVNVQKHLPGTMAADDYLARAEVVLCAHGFRGDNSIAVTNLCRDESTGILKSKIEAIFGANFNINGLGAVITCGVTGMGAGLSHAPIDPATKRERYVFFSFPHVAVDDEGNVGKIHRPGRPGESAACGALITALGAFQADGVDAHAKEAGNHDAEEPEFSILKHRLGRRIVSEGIAVDKLDVASITRVAERTITSDLEFLIERAVDTKKADYAVCTGIQIHSWPDPSTGAPAIEFVMPSKMYVVVDGKRTDIRLDAVPTLTPRQLAVLATSEPGIADDAALAHAYLSGSTVVEIPQPDPAGNPATVGTDPAARKLLFKNLKGDGEQSDHVVPKWADMYCC